ncbi:MAG: M48 family metalloprotease [Elusimicrobia bacterium]|nr:M48 family metalloprotease [Elusimicrobiota bacterium]
MASVLDKVRDAFKTAVNVTIEEASGLSFAKKLSNFVIALRNPDLMKKLADAHTEFNKGVGNANIEEITIPEQESKEESGREFSQEEITKNEQHLQKIISQNDIKYQYQPNPELKKDIEEIFGNLLDAMVAQGKITTEERQQYRIHYYYSPVANAYAVVNSKDVFLFSELIYELAEEMHKEGKKLTKDHIAAILAHELQHTTQENRIYDDYKATKGDGKRKEYDADRESIFILEQAGYNPRAVEEMMTALSLMSGSSLLEAFFDEHPNTKDRVKEISEILEDPSLVLLSMSANQQPMDVSSLAKYGQDFEEYLDKNIDKGSNHSYSLNAKALQKILDETDFFEQMSIFDMSKYINFYDRTTKEFIFNNILNGNYKFFTEGENNFIKNCSAEEKEFIYHLLFASSTIDNVVEKLENQQKMNLFDFCTNVLEFEKIRNPDILFSMVASMNPTQATLKAFLDFRENSGIKLSYTKETAYFYLTNYKYLLKGELSDLMEELIPRDKLGFLFENEDEYKLSMTFESFNQEQKNESIKIILKILKENKDLMLMGKDPMGFINFVMASDVLTKEEKLEYLLELSITIKKYEQEFGDILLDLFDDIYSDKSDFEKLVHLFEVLNASEKIGKLVDIFSYEKLITRYSISEHDFAAEELKDFAFTIKNFTISFDVFFLGYFLKLKNKDIKFYFVKDEESSHDKKYSNGVCLYPNINIENINRDLLKNMTLDDLIEFQNFMMDNHYYCQSVSLLARFVVDKVLNASDAEKIRVKKLLTLLPKGQESISLNGDVSAIPYEHLKNLVDIQNSYKDIDEQTRVLPVKETSFINFYVPFLEFRTFEPNYSAVPFEQIVENIKEHFDAYAYLKELLEAEENGEELEIYYSEGSGDMGNPDEPEQQIRNMEIEKAWLFELHRIFDLTPKEKNVEFNYEGETFVYAYLEMNEQLLGDAKFVPTAQQAQQLINAFSIIKKELPQETVDVYAKLIYSLLKRNSNLSVFSSAKANLELLDLLFEDFSVVKDDYITELLDNYDVTVEEYKEIISKTRLYFFGLNSRDNNKDIGNMEMINNILPTLSDSEKIKFFFWLLSGNDSYKPQMLRYDQVRIINFNYDGEINFSSLQQSFRLMTKTERENFIRKILLGSSGIIEQEKVTAERNAKEFEKGLKNILFDDFFISSLGGSSKIKASTISRVFKDVFSIVFNNLNYERKVLFVNNLISALAELKIDNKNANDEQKARQLGRLIVALGTSSGVAVVKLLQILSNNRVFEALDDKYGIIINEEVAKVKDENEPLSKSVLFQYLEKLGLSSSIEYVGKRLGSASIGLTYLLKLKDIKGLLVAKVKRPNINKSYDEDFDIADKLIEYFKNDSPLDDKYKKTLPNADKLRALFAEELKFEEESKNLADFSKQLEKRNSKIKVPQLIETVKDVTVHTQNLFLQTTAKGISLDKIKGSKKQKSRIYFEVLKEFFTEIFVDPIENGQALYHADLHTGNIFVDESGNISFIDLGGVGKVSAQQSKALKDIFMYLYSGNYDGFINALKLYNHEIYEQLEKESLAEENTLNKIKEILNRKTSLESKFVDLFEIFNSLEKIDNDFMMFIQAISKISAYLDNLDKKDQLSLLNNLSFNRGIQFKIILDNVLTAVVSTFKKIHFGKKQKEEEGHEITREDMFREKLLSNYPDINSEDIDLLLSLDPFVLEYIKNNTVSLTEEQLIKGATLADKLYKQQIITEQNNKINILFKIVSITSFSDKNIEKLLALDENTIEKIISEITEDEKIEIVFTKAEQLDIDLVYKNDTFGSENRNFDRLLTFVKGAKLNRSQDFFYMFDWETELRKANVLFGLPVDFAKILLKDERKLSFIADIVKNTDLSLDEDSDIINIIMSLSKEEIDNIEFEIRTLSGNGKKYIRRFFYMYRDYKNLFSGKDGARIIGSLIITNENDELLREMFNSAKNEETIEFIAYKGIDVYSRDGKFASETLLEIILFRCKALNIDIDVNNPAFVDTTKALNVITSTGQERISNLDEDTYKNLFSVKDQDSFIELLKYISQYSYYDRRGFESLLNKALSSERTEIEVSYDKNDHVIVLLIKKDDRTQYSVRLALARITEEDKVRQDYIKTGIPDRKMFVYLSSIGDNAFSKATTEYTTIEDIEKLTGVKIEVSGNTIVAKSMKTGTYISCVKNRDISQIVSSLKVQQIPVIDDQQKSDVENIANAEVTEAICLDESPEIILEKLKRAIENNSLIVIYPFSHTYDIDSLTNDELYALYFDIQNKFFDLQELLEDNNCLPNIDDRRNMAYVLKELIKNAFVHGNLSDTSNPMYVKFVRNGFTVINARHTSKDDKNRLRRLNLSAAATLTGAHRGLQIIQDYEKQGLIKVTPEQERNIEVGNKGYFVITAVKTTGDKSGFRSLMERVDSIATIKKDTDTKEAEEKNKRTIEYINGSNDNNMVAAQRAAEKVLAETFTPEELETVDLLASVIFDSIKYVNSPVNTSSIEFVNIVYALEEGLFNYNLFPNEGEDLKQHILKMLNHYVEVSKQKKGTGQDNILVKVLSEKETLLDDMADYLCDIIIEKNLIEKNKLETKQRKANMKRFIDGVKSDNMRFSAVMICSANENRSAIWHVMFKDFLEKYNKKSISVFSAGVFYDISQRFMNDNNTIETKPLVEDYIETLSSDERYRDINENLKNGFRSRYIKYLNIPKKSQPVFIVAGEQHRAQLIKLGYDPSWIFLMSDFYSEEFKRLFRAENIALARDLEENNIFSMSEFPDPYENQILRQDLPELVRSVVEYSFGGETVQQQIPEEFITLTDDYNQFEHMENLPDFAETKYAEERRQNTIQAFNEQIEDIYLKKHQFIFRGNTKYLYLLQNRKNKYVLMNIASQPGIDLKFRLFSLLYLDKLSRELTNEEKANVEKYEKAIVKKLKKQIEGNEIKVLNNLDLRAYMMGIYLILKEHAHKKNVPDIIDKAIIINFSDGKMGRDDGLFAEIDLFVVIHELTHRMFDKPKDWYRPVDEALDELVSYITPNMFLRKIMALPFNAYSERQKRYMMHQTDGIIDYINMGVKFHSLYSMFDKKANEYEIEQEVHSGPLAFLDYLFNAHQKIGKSVDWDTLLEVIDDLSVSKVEQLQMFRKILNSYLEYSIDKGLLTKEETETIKKEIEEMQTWTLLIREVIEIIEGSSPNSFNLLKGNKTALEYKSEILSKPNKMKENFEEVLRVLQWNSDFSKDELLVLLIMNIMKKVEYEQLVNNFDGVINGIIDVINNASGELKLDLGKNKYSRQEYQTILNFVLANYNVSDRIETSIADDIFVYISKNLDKFSFASKLINMVFGTENLTKIFGNKKLLIANSKQQEENLRKQLSNRNDIAVVTMEIINDRVYDIRKGIFLDVQKGIKAKYDSKENKITVYSKEGIKLTENEIKDLIMKQYFAERNEDSFDDVIAFAEIDDSSLQDITDRLHNAYTDSVSIPSKENVFDLSLRPIKNNLTTICKQEFISTGIKTFIITSDQVKDYIDEIQKLREQGFKFIISCKADNIIDITNYDGLIIDDSVKDYEDISQLLTLMERTKKQIVTQGVAKQVFVKFSNDTYGKFNSANIDIFDSYGAIPIVMDSYIVNSMLGKFTVEKIRDNDINIEMLIRKNNVIGFVVDNARLFADKKSKLRELLSKEHKYNKGYNASLSSKFDYVCYDVPKLETLLSIDINNEQQMATLQNINLENLELSPESFTYLNYLKNKGRYEEMLGFIRGIAMNSARVQIIGALTKQGANLDMDKFAEEAGGKYQKAFLTVAVQLMMSDIDITELLKTGFIDSDMTMKEYLDSVYEKVNINIEEILKQNEFKINKIKEEDTPKTIEDFKNYVVLLDNLKIVKETNANFDMSMKAVRNMLSAA